MISRFVLALIALLALNDIHAAAEDDPVLLTIMVDKVEWRDADDGDFWVWDADAWVGKDLHKIWVKSEGERISGVTETGFAELFYSRAITTYWDLQAGWRHDFEPEPNRDWLAVGFKGLSPYFFEVDATLYAGGNGALAGRIDAEYEILLTQRLILSPEVEVDFYGKDDVERGIGSGFSTLEVGLRLRYEFRREFGPYIGINWEKKLGSTAGLARAEGEQTDDLQFVAGVRAWF